MSKRKTKDIFIKESINIHGNKYDYSLVDYRNNHTKVKIKCLEHGIFEVRPNDHLSKKVGCNKCNNAGISKKNKFSKKIISNFKKKHGEKYCYDFVNYLGIDKKIMIICPFHGEFWQTPKHHLNGCGCQECGNVKKMTNKNFIEKSINIHGNKYDYSLVDYRNNHTKVKIKCLEHGIFELRPNDHLSKKVGCPLCRSSKGELLIKNFLEKNNILFILQKKFLKCKNKRLLPFDFFLPQFNICIEYDGEQHYRQVPHWGGIEGLKKINKNDEIKDKYCKENNIKLLRFNFKDDIIKKLVDTFK